MNKIIVLGKVKFDLRDPDEAYFAKYEFESIMGVDVTPVRTISALFKTHPLNKLDDELNADKLIFQPAFLKQVYLIIETDRNKEDILRELNLVGTEKLYNVFSVTLNNSKKLFTLRLLPIQTLFEYGVEVKNFQQRFLIQKTTTTGTNILKRKNKVLSKD